MKVLSREKIKVLSEKNGWSLARAEGFVDGEVFRRRGKPPSTYARVGIDDYSLGFRAGYYERQEVTPMSEIAPIESARLMPVNPKPEGLEVVPATAHGM